MEQKYLHHLIKEHILYLQSSNSSACCQCPILGDFRQSLIPALFRDLCSEVSSGHVSPPPLESCVSVFIFNPFFNHFYRPTCPTVPTLSLCFPMSPYVISMISTFFPTLQTPTLLSLSFSSRPFTRYQEQDLLVVNFGLLRAISTISTILMIPTISLPPPELLYDLPRCSLQPCEHLTNSLEIENSLLQHLNLRSYW